MNWNSVIGIFGGSFDPPHLGHRAAAEGLLQNPGLRSVWILPSGTPPWKAGATPADIRLELAQENFKNLPDVSVLDWEVELARKHPAEPTTTWRTLDAIAPRLQGAEIAWVIGADQLLDLERWHRFPELLARCHWVVLLRRPGSEAGGAGSEARRAAILKKLHHWEASGLVRQENELWRIRSNGPSRFLGVFTTEAPALSSTEIRESIARLGDTAPLEGKLAPGVVVKLKEKGLYGSRRHVVQN